MRFLKGNVLFFALILLVIMLFSYYAVQRMEHEAKNSASCKVLFDRNMVGEECKVFLDNTLLFEGVVCGVDTVLEMTRYSDGKNSTSRYTSASSVIVVDGADTVVHKLGGDRLFSVARREGKCVVLPIE